MRTWQKASKLAAVVTVAGGLALTGTSAAVAGETLAQKRIGQCGTGVFLDGIRAISVSESGRDEVYITSNGTKIWPVTGAYVSMAAGQRVEVDKCVPSNAQIRIWDEDTADWDDDLGGFKVQGEVTRNYEPVGAGHYRIGAIA
ncbi:hypothetical protein [Actinomadura sp. 21ATH]|uniref:hypothetical protein n=1 Tax=Actinomadura sp. 21ATH TaxID=1735444 RepID=UPI0035BFE2DF